MPEGPAANVLNLVHSDFFTIVQCYFLMSSDSSPAPSPDSNSREPSLLSPLLSLLLALIRAWKTRIVHLSRRQHETTHRRFGWRHDNLALATAEWS
mmetsp:Transcript_633/g.1683  ORF Transcript_633/g.1683 Transcript_633/m.1683 type:complete len:96 (-) Transcript_633:835-1122(-)